MVVTLIKLYTKGTNLQFIENKVLNYHPLPIQIANIVLDFEVSGTIYSFLANHRGWYIYVCRHTQARACAHTPYKIGTVLAILEIVYQCTANISDIAIMICPILPNSNTTIIMGKYHYWLRDLRPWWKTCIFKASI